jgi:hypothetical protein
MTGQVIDPDASLRAEVARLQREVHRLENELKIQRELILGCAAFRNFNDTAAAGYIDRTGLEGP